MYFTNPGQIEFISGVQGRYFIPIFLLLTVSINKLNIHKFNYLKRSIVFVVPYINLFVLYKYYDSLLIKIMIKKFIYIIFILFLSFL